MFHDQYLRFVVIEDFLLDDNDICFHVEDQIKMKEKIILIFLDDGKKKERTGKKREFVLKLKAID